MSLRIAAVAAVLLVAAAATALGQGPGSAGRSRGSALPPLKPVEEAPARRLAPEPLLSLEHELPSLRQDLRIEPAQGPAWDAFARTVREVAELTRAREKRLLSARAPDAPPRSAIAFLAALAEDDRLRADAVGDLLAQARTLYATFDPAQRTLFDRRIALAHTEPLGIR